MNENSDNPLPFGRSPDCVKRHALYTLPLPNYLTSRDAIVPVIEKWCNSSGRKAVFVNSLRELLYGHCESWQVITIDMVWGIVKATPSQLCEALLRATGKWIED